MISDEGKKRLVPSQQELTCAEDMKAKTDDQSGAIFASSSNKRPLVELSEADSTVTNGLDDTELQQQNDTAPPAKKQCCMDGDKEINICHPSSNASSTTNSPHETVSNFLSHAVLINNTI